MLFSLLLLQPEMELFHHILPFPYHWKTGCYLHLHVKVHLTSPEQNGPDPYPPLTSERYLMFFHDKGVRKPHRQKWDEECVLHTLEEVHVEAKG